MALLKRIVSLFDGFSPDAVYGIVLGVVGISLAVYRAYGLDFHLSPQKTQLHLVTVNWLAVMVGWYYNRFPSKPHAPRFLSALLCTIIIWELHDLLWLFQTHFIGAKFGDSLTVYPSVGEYLYIYSRNLSILAVAVVVAVKQKIVHVSKMFLLGLPLQLFIHGWIVVHDLYVFELYTHLVDWLPYLFLFS